MTRLAQLIARAPVATYFGLALLFTWSLLPFAKSSIPVSFLALFGPAAAAVIVAAASGRQELLALRRRVTDWRIPPRWYLCAVLLPLPISALRSGIEYALGARGPIQLQPISPLGLVVLVLVAGEEIGWRGFALPHLLRRFGPWSASTIIGAVWAVWHLPLFYLPGMPQFGGPFPPYVAYTIALSVILTFFAGRTRGSVVIATVFHGSAWSTRPPPR